MANKKGKSVIISAELSAKVMAVCVVKKNSFSYALLSTLLKDFIKKELKATSEKNKKIIDAYNNIDIQNNSPLSEMTLRRAFGLERALSFFKNSELENLLQSFVAPYEEQLTYQVISPFLEQITNQSRNSANSNSNDIDSYKLMFYPSMVLALGYFENFVLNLCRELTNSSEIKVGNNAYNKFIMHVVVPKSLKGDFTDQVIKYNKNFVEKCIETNIRKCNFFVAKEEEGNDVLNIYDIPTTLRVLKNAVERVTTRQDIEEGEVEIRLKTIELENFSNALTKFVKENPITRDNVKVEFM